MGLLLGWARVQQKLRGFDKKKERLGFESQFLVSEIKGVVNNYALKALGTSLSCSLTACFKFICTFCPRPES